MKIHMIGFVLAGAMLASSASANEFVLTSAKAKGSQAVALDFVNEGSATALQLRFNLNKGAKVDLSKCVSSLPSSHSGQCAVSGDVLTVLVYSDENALLPEGLVSIGSVNVSSRDARGAMKVALKEALAFDVSGNEIKSSSTQDQVDVLK